MRKIYIIETSLKKNLLFVPFNKFFFCLKKSFFFFERKFTQVCLWHAAARETIGSKIIHRCLWYGQARENLHTGGRSIVQWFYKHLYLSWLSPYLNGWTILRRDYVQTKISPTRISVFLSIYFHLNKKLLLYTSPIMKALITFFGLCGTNIFFRAVLSNSVVEHLSTVWECQKVRKL
jgi:hypothetical protein